MNLSYIDTNKLQINNLIPYYYYVQYTICARLHNKHYTNIHKINYLSTDMINFLFECKI